jgi:hypothetical protein
MWITHFKKLTCIKDFQRFENFNVIRVDWETCDVRITCNWCNQLLNVLGMCNLKSRAIFWTLGDTTWKK